MTISYFYILVELSQYLFNILEHLQVNKNKIDFEKI